MWWGCVSHVVAWPGHDTFNSCPSLSIWLTGNSSDVQSFLLFFPHFSSIAQFDLLLGVIVRGPRVVVVGFLLVEGLLVEVVEGLLLARPMAAAAIPVLGDLVVGGPVVRLRCAVAVLVGAAVQLIQILCGSPAVEDVLCRSLAARLDLLAHALQLARWNRATSSRGWQVRFPLPLCIA
jgi:hypothetical protein